MIRPIRVNVFDFWLLGWLTWHFLIFCNVMAWLCCANLTKKCSKPHVIPLGENKKKALIPLCNVIYVEIYAAAILYRHYRLMVFFSRQRKGGEMKQRSAWSSGKSYTWSSQPNSDVIVTHGSPWKRSCFTPNMLFHRTSLPQYRFGTTTSHGCFVIQMQPRINRQLVYSCTLISVQIWTCTKYRPVCNACTVIYTEY